MKQKIDGCDHGAVLSYTRDVYINMDQLLLHTQWTDLALYPHQPWLSVWAGGNLEHVVWRTGSSRYVWVWFSIYSTFILHTLQQFLSAKNFMKFIRVSHYDKTISVLIYIIAALNAPSFTIFSFFPLFVIRNEDVRKSKVTVFFLRHQSRFKSFYFQESNTVKQSPYWIFIANMSPFLPQFICGDTEEATLPWLMSWTNSGKIRCVSMEVFKKLYWLYRVLTPDKLLRASMMITCCWILALNQRPDEILIRH